MKLGSILTTPHSSEACMVLLNGLELELSQNYELSRESSFIIETCNQPLIPEIDRNAAFEEGRIEC